MKKERKGKVALIISLIVFFVCICTCIYITKNRITPTKIINSVKRDIKIEVDITDSSIKKDLSNKIDYLLYGKEIDTKYINLYELRRGDESIRGNIFNELDNSTRLRVILDYLNNLGKFNQLKDKITGIEDVDSTIRFMGLDTVKQISSKEVEKHYKELFGDKEFKLEDIKGCIGYYYDEKKELYYSLDSTCGGSSNIYVDIYKTNYRKYKDNAYVDVYFGYVKQDDNSYVGYKDYDMTRTIDIEDLNLDKKIISEDNYNEFEHFKFNFKIDNSNNYYFTEITR